MLMLAILVLLLFPIFYVLGRAALVLLYGRRRQKEFAWEDGILTGGLLAIGLAEGAHLGALVHGQSVSVASKYYFAMMVTALIVSLAVLTVVYFTGKKEEKQSASESKQGSKALRSGKMSENKVALTGILLLFLLAQLTAILLKTAVYTDYDLTLETVVTFLKEDRLYGSNPLTGFPYQSGIPSRLKILCLPTLYSVICRWTGCSPELLVYHVLPCIVLIFAYLAYGSLSRALFPEKGLQRYFFFVLCGNPFLGGRCHVRFGRLWAYA